MPLYEYVCEQDGEVLELIRPMAQADAPVDDPKGLDRTFVRKHSTFGTKAAAPASVSLPAGCACGNPHGPCSN